MDNVQLLQDNEELTHWGIKGMRWGVRRYQNKDGTLTAAGKKRLAKETEAANREAAVLKNRKATLAKISKLEAKKKANEELKEQLDGPRKKKRGSDDSDAEAAAKKSGKKSMKDMTDEELVTAIRRAQLERQYSDLTAQPQQAQQVTKGRGFIKDFMDKSVVPAAQEAGRNLIKDSIMKFGKKKLGLEAEPNADEALERTAKRLTNEWKTLDMQNRINKIKAETEAGMAAERAKQEKKNSSDQDSANKPKSKVDNYESITKWQKNVDDYYDRMKKEKVTVTSKDYERETDRILSEIDNDGWDQYYRLTGK